MKERYKWLIGIVGVILIIALVTYILPVKSVDMGCYKEIANKVCGEEEMMWYGLNGFLTSGATEFSCCEPEPEVKSRKILDSIRSCDGYRFIEDDDKECSKLYKHWKLVS